MSRESDLIEKLIDQYGLSAPFTQEEKKKADISSRRVLKNSLKKAGKFSIPMAIFVFIYNLCKKLGISMMTFYVLVGSGLVGGIGTYLILQQIADKDVIKAEEKVIEQNKPVKIVQKEIVYKAGFKKFYSLDKTIPQALINRISNSIIQECNRLKGQQYAGIISNEKNYRYISRGEVVTLDKKVSIVIRTGETGTTLFKGQVREDGELDNIDELCKSVARAFIKHYENIK